MTQWNNAWYRVDPTTGQAYIVPQQNNPVADWWVDQWVWVVLQMYFAPYRIMGNSEIEEFMQQFTLNGIRSNLCKSAIT